MIIMKGVISDREISDWRFLGTNVFLLKHQSSNSFDIRVYKNYYTFYTFTCLLFCYVRIIKRFNTWYTTTNVCTLNVYTLLLAYGMS